MKKFIATITLVFVFINASYAQSDYSLTWSVSGIDNVDKFEMDINFGNRYLAANGAVVHSNGNSVPLSGTCFQTAQAGVFCTFSFQQGSTLVLDLQSSLNGTLRNINVTGQAIETGFLRLVNIF